MEVITRLQSIDGSLDADGVPVLFNSARHEGDTLSSAPFTLTLRVSPAPAAAVAALTAHKKGARLSLEAAYEALVSCEVVLWAGEVVQTFCATGPHVQIHAQPKIHVTSMERRRNGEVTLMLTVERKFPLSSSHGAALFRLAFTLAPTPALPADFPEGAYLAFTESFRTAAKQAKSGTVAKSAAVTACDDMTPARAARLAALQLLVKAHGGCAVLNGDLAARVSLSVSKDTLRNAQLVASQAGEDSMEAVAAVVAMRAGVPDLLSSLSAAAATSGAASSSSGGSSSGGQATGEPTAEPRRRKQQPSLQQPVQMSPAPPPPKLVLALPPPVKEEEEEEEEAEAEAEAGGYADEDESETGEDAGGSGSAAHHVVGGLPDDDGDEEEAAVSPAASSGAGPSSAASSKSKRRGRRAPRLGAARKRRPSTSVGGGAAAAAGAGEAVRPPAKRPRLGGATYGAPGVLLPATPAPSPASSTAAQLPGLVEAGRVTTPGTASAPRRRSTAAGTAADASSSSSSGRVASGIPLSALLEPSPGGATGSAIGRVGFPLSAPSSSSSTQPSLQAPAPLVVDPAALTAAAAYNPTAALMLQRVEQLRGPLLNTSTSAASSASSSASSPSYRSAAAVSDGGDGGTGDEASSSTDRSPRRGAKEERPELSLRGARGGEGGGPRTALAPPHSLVGSPGMAGSAGGGTSPGAGYRRELPASSGLPLSRYAPGFAGAPRGSGGGGGVRGMGAASAYQPVPGSAALQASPGLTALPAPLGGVFSASQRGPGGIHATPPALLYGQAGPASGSSSSSDSDVGMTSLGGPAGRSSSSAAGFPSGWPLFLTPQATAPYPYPASLFPQASTSVDSSPVFTGLPPQVMNRYVPASSLDGSGNGSLWAAPTHPAFPAAQSLQQPPQPGGVQTLVQAAVQQYGSGSGGAPQASQVYVTLQQLEQQVQSDGATAARATMAAATASSVVATQGSATEAASVSGDQGSTSSVPPRVDMEDDLTVGGEDVVDHSVGHGQAVGLGLGLRAHHHNLGAAVQASPGSAAAVAPESPVSVAPDVLLPPPAAASEGPPSIGPAQTTLSALVLTGTDGDAEDSSNQPL